MRRCARSAIATDEPALREPAHWIESKGGLRNIRVFTRYWLALIGEWPWEKTPNLPPEVIWLPLWFPFSIYNFAQWARATLMPIALLSARRPSRPLPPENRLDALFPGGRDKFDYELPQEGRRRRLGPFLPRRRQGPARAAGRSARSTASRFGARRGGRARAGMDRSPSGRRRRLGRHPAAVDLQPDGARTSKAMRSTIPCSPSRLRRSTIPPGAVDEGEATFIGATNSPVWDTMLDPARLRGRGSAGRLPRGGREGGGMAARPASQGQGRLVVKLPDVEPGGWAFEYANNSYPDIDDTAVALIALAPFRNDPKFRARGIEEAIAARGRLVDRHAEPRRRLGRLRQGQRQEDPHQNPVLRLRRGARPALGRRHRACGRGFRQARDFARASRDGPRARLSEGASRRRTGRGSAAGASTTSTARRRRCRRWPPSARTCARPISAAPAIGWSRASRRTAAGARAAPPTWT